MIKNIILEKPISWINCDPIGYYVKIFYDNLLNIISKYNVYVKIIDIEYYTIGGLRYDRTPEFDYNNTLYFSYHTYGVYKPNLYRIKESYLPGFFTFDPLGYSGFSEFSDKNHIDNIEKINYDIANKYINNLHNILILKNQSKYPQKQNIQDTNIFNDAIFFPLQVYNDTVLDLSSINFYTLIDSVCNNITLPIVIKPHPFSVDIDFLNTKLSDLAAKNANIHISDCSIYDILSKCKCCLTINSGVGFEALLMNKPVITFGKSDYSSLTYSLDNINHINNQIINNCILNHNNINTTKFIYYYLTQYCLNYNDISNIELKINELLLNS